MDARSDVLAPVRPSSRAASDLEATFHAEYGPVARAIARVIRDPARAEELAVEVFLKWSRTQPTDGENAAGWLRRAAVRVALDELRRQARRARSERLLAWVRGAPTPEEIAVSRQEADRVRRVLGAMPTRQAELLLLRHSGFSYEELAVAMHVNPSSIGTLLGRAQAAFRREYLRRHGTS